MTESILSFLHLFYCFDKLSSFSPPYVCSVWHCDSNRSFNSLSEYPRKMKSWWQSGKNCWEQIITTLWTLVPWYTDWNFSIEASNGFHEVYPTLFWAIKFICYISKHWKDIKSLWKGHFKYFFASFWKKQTS